MGELIQKEPLLPGKGEIDQINLVSLLLWDIYPAYNLRMLTSICPKDAQATRETF